LETKPPEQRKNQSGVSQQVALSPTAAQAVIHKAAEAGRVDFRSHISARMIEREFTSLEMERVLRCGAVRHAPEYDIKRGNWKYRIGAVIEGCTLEIVLAIDAVEDYDLDPLILPITGCWTGRGTHNGKRADRTIETSNRGKTHRKGP